MVVVDASAAVLAAIDRGERGAACRQQITEEAAAPWHFDAEAGQSIRGLVLRRQLTSVEGRRTLELASGLASWRYPLFSLAERAWELANSVSFYDALYVSLAERLEAALVTADGRLTRADGPRCEFVLV